MQITTKDIIKILPFEDQLKTSLLDNFDNLNPDQKLAIEQLLWQTYESLFKLKLEENTQMALLRAKEGREKLDKEFYKRVREQTEKEMQSETIQTTQDVDLSEARKAMEVIIKEIQASKNK